MGVPWSATAVREFLPAVWGFGLPAMLVLYLGLKGGGYDTVVRSEVGIAVWWLVLLRCCGRGAPATPRPRVGWVGLGPARRLRGLDRARHRLVGEQRAQRRRARAGGHLPRRLRPRAAHPGPRGLRGERSAASAPRSRLVALLALLSRLHPGSSRRTRTVGVPRRRELGSAIRSTTGTASRRWSRSGSRCCSAGDPGTARSARCGPPRGRSRPWR